MTARITIEVPLAGDLTAEHARRVAEEIGMSAVEGLRWKTDVLAHRITRRVELIVEDQIGGK